MLMNIPNMLTDDLDNIEAWLKKNNGNPLLLDLRPNNSSKPAYFVKHSTWIPIETARGRWSELPNKRQSFSVLLSDNNNELEFEFLKSIIEKGWKIEFEFFFTIKFFENCLKLNLICNFNEIKFNLLFDPNFFLKSKLNIIQASLFLLSSGKNEWKVMDLGCGSGRDLVYLSIVNSNWNCFGLDSWKGSIQRCEQLFNNLQLSAQLKKLNLIKFTKDGSIKDLESGISYNEYSAYDPVDNLFHLVIIIRFLIRDHFEILNKMINPEGFLLICTFINLPDVDYDSPKGRDHRLEPGELKEYFVDSLGYELIEDSIGYIEDGRPVNCFLARKKFGLLINPI